MSVQELGWISILDSIRDLQGGLAGCEVRGVDDLGLPVQPGARRFGVGLEVVKAEGGWARAERSVSFDALAECVLGSVEDEMP